MKIAILGTGMVGQTLAAALSALGHSVMVGTRNVAATQASTQPNGYGMPAFSVWHQTNSAVALGSFAQAAQFGELLINASNGGVSMEVLAQAEVGSVGNKVLIDVANDLDFSKGMPPASRGSDVAGAGLGERIQAAYPNLRVVKTLNTMSAFVMVKPSLVAADSTVFMSGNDAAAKGVVQSLLLGFGWTDIMDLGDIASCRSTEMLMPIWLRTWGVMGQTPFNFKIAR